MKAKSKFEKMSPKYFPLKKALPSAGARSCTPPFCPRMMNEPTIISKIEINLTKIIVICTNLVFYMLLKEKAAPKTKKSPSQK